MTTICLILAVGSVSADIRITSVTIDGHPSLTVLPGATITVITTANVDLIESGCNLQWDVGDGDGVINSLDACPNNAPGLPVDAHGRPLRDCNNDCLYNAADIQCIVDEMLNQ